MENVTQSSRVILTWNICDHNLEYFINNTSHESYLLHPRPLSTQFKHQCWHQCQFSISIFDVGFSSCKTCHTVSFGGVNCDFRVRNLINYLDIFAAKNAYILAKILSAHKKAVYRIYYIISTYLDRADFCTALRNIFLSNIKFLACYPPDRGDTCELCARCATNIVVGAHWVPRVVPRSAAPVFPRQLPGQADLTPPSRELTAATSATCVNI